MNDIANREQRKQQKVNGWKWAFILLVIFIGFLFLLFIWAIQPVEKSPSSQPTSELSGETIELTTSMEKEEAEQLINMYLTYSIGEEYAHYRIVLTDQLEIHGILEFLGFDVPFALFLDPYVMENGNVQLRGKAVEVANFSLPVSLVMRLVENQVAFPAFIAFDSESQIIVIHLDQLTAEDNFAVEMTTIDLNDGLIELNIRFDEEVILEQLEQIDSY